MLVSVVIITRNRPLFLSQCLNSILRQTVTAEIIVVDNASDDHTLEMLHAEYPMVTVLKQAHNTGVPGGRNIGIRYARGEICLCMDDDAELTDPAALEKCITYFEQRPRLACLSLRVLNYRGEVARKLIPRRDRRIITDDTPGALFAGTGFVLRRSAFLDAGGFWEDLNPYFGEETDLSYRLLEKEYDILLTPHIAVLHHETEVERHPSRRLFCGTRNAPWIAIRSLPWYSVISLTVLPWAYFFVVAVMSGQLGAYTRAVSASIRHMPAVWRIRRPVSGRTRKILRENSGLIFW